MTPSKRLLAVVLTFALGLGVWTLAFTFQSATFADGDVLSATELNALLNDNFQAASDAVDTKVDLAGDAMTGPLAVEADATTSADSVVFHAENTAATGTTGLFGATSDDTAVAILQEGAGPVLTLKTTGTGPLIAASGFLVTADGNVEIAGNITNSVGSGLPVAFGRVTAAGDVAPNASTTNWSVTQEAGPRYRISIDDEAYIIHDYVTTVTPAGGTARIATTDSLSGDLLVYVFDSAGAQIANSFAFTTFKPGD